MDIFNKNNKEKSLAKIQLSITLILILFCCVTGATYAYLYATNFDDETISGDMATVNLTLDVAKVFPTANSENTGVMVPQLSTSNSANSPLASALKSGCVDGNGNIVCQVYKVNIQNVGGTATQVVDGEILFYGDNELTTDVKATMPNLKWRMIDEDGVNETTPSNSILGINPDLVADANDDNIFADDLTMTTNSGFTYYIIIWINETNSDQTVDEGNSFYARVEFNASNGTGITATFSNHTSFPSA